MKVHLDVQRESSSRRRFVKEEQQKEEEDNGAKKSRTNKDKKHQHLFKYLLQADGLLLRGAKKKEEGERFV